MDRLIFVMKPKETLRQGNESYGVINFRKMVEEKPKLKQFYVTRGVSF
jgi:hypothetical protein